MAQKWDRSTAPACSAAEATTASDLTALRCMVVTISDSRTLATDQGGGYLAEALAAAGHKVLARRIVADEVAAIRARVLDAVESAQIDVLLLKGGTGIAPRDVTPDAVAPLFSKRLPGFGELLRQLSFERLGAQSVLTRGEAGVIARVLVFILPGRPEACRLAMDVLIAPILRPAVAQLRGPAATEVVATTSPGSA